MSATRSALLSRLVPLRDPAFRRLLAGRTVSFLGDGLFLVAAMWLVYDLTGSTAATGLAGFLSRAPNALKLFAGPLVDRARLGRVLVAAELWGAGVVVLVPLAAATGSLDVRIVLATLPLLALGELFATPAQSATLPRLLAGEELVRGNSVFAVATNAADAGARAAAGALVAAAGAVTAFLVDAATFLVAGLLFALASVPPREGEGTPSGALDFRGYVAELWEGARLLSGSPAGAMLAASLAANFAASAAFAVLPAFAAARGGPGAYGLFVAALTGGAVVGSFVAPAVDEWPLGAVTVAGFVLAAGCWIAGVAAGGVTITAALFVASRVPVGVYNVSVQATLQQGVPDGLLGRVTATVSSVSNVVGPAGLLVGGVVGDAVGAVPVLYAAGGGFLAAAAAWLAVPTLRRFGPPTRVEPGAFG